MLSNEKRLDNLKPEENQQEGSDNQSFNPIIDGLNSIIETLRGDRKFNKKKTEKQRKEKEKTKRASKEKLLEGAKGVWKGITKVAGKILSPFQKLWSDILGFLSAIFVGRVLYKLVDWVGNPENQGKIKSIFRFLKDWWPVLLGAYLVFGTGLVGFATGFISTLVGFASTLVGTVIPALISAATAMGPWGLAALALLGTAAIISTKKNKTDQKVDQSVKEVGAEETSNIIKDQQENRSPLQKAGDFLTGADQERKEQIQKLDTGTEKRYGFFGEIKPKEMNKGGEVPGSGNTDTVPAMLTPGEFVMSKGAVQQYGVDTLEGMNAAAGGTNTPTPMSMNQQIMQQTDETGTFGEDGFSMSTYQATPEQRHASYAEMGIPSMELWDGSVVPNFGKMGKDEMLEGIAITRENLVNDGAPQEVLDRLDSLEMMQVNGMAGPDFIQNTINKLVPGSQEQVLGDLGDSISANARMGYAGGGLVKGNSGGGLQLIGPSKGYGEAKGGSKKFSGSQLKNLLNDQKAINLKLFYKEQDLLPKSEQYDFQMA